MPTTSVPPNRCKWWANCDHVGRLAPPGGDHLRHAAEIAAEHDLAIGGDRDTADLERAQIAADLDAGDFERGRSVGAGKTEACFRFRLGSISRNATRAVGHAPYAYRRVPS